LISVNFDSLINPDALDAILADEGVPPLLAKLVARRIKSLSHRHRQLAMEYGGERAVQGVEAEMQTLLEELGVGITACFGGDIRGPTVRLKLPSGRCNGFVDGLWVVYTDG
jgi:hypothetical protein